MNDRIAVIYTTFLRDWLFRKTIKSITKYGEYGILIGDQGRENDKDFYSPEWHILKALWIRYPFDCGVSFVRNDLIGWAKKLNFEYCLLTADSIEFTLDTIANLDKAVQFLKNHDVGILGFDLKNRVPWEYFMDIQNSCFQLKKNDNIETDPLTGLRFKRCDICRQFFLAKIDTILSVKWDEALKTGEHEDFFWRYKQAGHKVCWTPDISANYIDYKPAEYLRYRNRQYNEFRKLLFNKYKLNDWVQYI
jgi:hypothetical protein